MDGLTVKPVTGEYNCQNLSYFLRKFYNRLNSSKIIDPECVGISVIRMG